MKVCVNYVYLDWYLFYPVLQLYRLEEYDECLDTYKDLVKNTQVLYKSWLPVFSLT